MAQFFKATANKKKQLSTKLTLKVDRLDHLGAGMAQHQGKVVFIPGALAGEHVTAQLTQQKKNFARGKLIKINSAAAERVSPACEHYQDCGGCDLQHLAIDEQRAHKARTLTNLLQRFSERDTASQRSAKLKNQPKHALDAASVLAPSLVGEAWGYRRRTRLATLYDPKTRRVRLGFRQAASNQVVEIKHCLVLEHSLSRLIPLFAEALNKLSAKKALGHLELTQADNGIFAVLRVTAALPDKDKQTLRALGDAEQLNLLLLDNAGISTALTGQTQPFYQLQTDKLAFAAGNFIQVNRDMNQAMVTQAMAWLAPKAGERILDLFCGVGNFSLALARAGAEVIGVEGVSDMVRGAQRNASANGLDNASFYHADLSADLSGEPWLGKVDKILLDPARAGAYESLNWLNKLQPQVILYVSCDPVSLARDTALILNKGYRLTKIAMIDMFPQTHHLESMVLFETN